MWFFSGHTWKEAHPFFICFQGNPRRVEDRRRRLHRIHKRHFTDLLTMIFIFIYVTYIFLIDGFWVFRCIFVQSGEESLILNYVCVTVKKVRGSCSWAENQHGRLVSVSIVQNVAQRSSEQTSAWQELPKNTETNFWKRYTVCSLLGLSPASHTDREEFMMVFCSSCGRYTQSSQQSWVKISGIRPFTAALSKTSQRRSIFVFDPLQIKPVGVESRMKRYIKT